ncbi:hypothetical protein SAMN04487912_10420 [Arthrobacter sp. cf158]|nr:hypothetical protein SAMN04487912_10420 [Arthrobacter sp. cf158]
MTRLINFAGSFLRRLAGTPEFRSSTFQRRGMIQQNDTPDTTDAARGTINLQLTVWGQAL